jgi:hypothetical protein
LDAESAEHTLGVAFVKPSPLMPPDGLPRYRSTIVSRQDARSDIALRATIAAFVTGAAWLFCVLGGRHLLELVCAIITSAFLVYVCGAGAVAGLASTRPWWGCEVRGSVYRDRRTFLPEKRYDLATATSAYVRNVHTSPGEYVYMSSDRLYLGLSLPGRGKRKIPLAGGTAFSGVNPDQARLMLALADALAESSDCGATGQAVTDLRMLATAPSGQVLEWMGTTGRLRPGKR